MAAREDDTRLKELRDSGVEIYSISRLATINNCLAEAYKTYVLKDRGKNNIYGMLGTRIHDTLEAIVNEKATEADLLPAMNSEFYDLDLMGIEFPKDFKGGDSIREGWIADMTHFCNTYKSPRGKDLHTEELFIYKTPKGRYLQGYIDLYSENKDGSISIYDYKTSSMYAGDALKEHGYQLVTYLLGKEQEGFNVKSVAWIFLKYVNVEFMGYKTAKSKEKTLLTKTIERRKLGAELTKYIENDLSEAGYDDADVEIFLSEVKTSNMLDSLPDDIKDKYKIKPCVLNYEITDEVKQECINYIDSTIDMWEALDKDNETLYTPRKFTKINKFGKEFGDYFYCTNLCGHFKDCVYIHDYLDTLQNNASDDEDLF